MLFRSNDTATTEIYTIQHTLSLHDALPISARAEASLPRLRAAYVQAVQIYAAGLAPGAPPNTDFLSLTLQRETDQILGKRGAKLLLGAVVVN